MTGPAQWTGMYYDGRTAGREPVTLVLDGAGLLLRRADGTSRVFPISALRQTQGTFSGEQLRIEFGSDPVEVILVNEAGLANAIREMYPDAAPGWRGHRSTWTLVAWGVGGLAAAALLYFWSAPIIATWLAPTVPVQWEVEMGRTVAERMAPPPQRCGDSASLRQLRLVLDRLITAAPRSPYEFRIAVVRDTTVNAFAAPGGFIAVNSGLLAATRRPEELAGVLAHEIQHVTHRHSTRAMIREMPLRFALWSLSGSGGMETAAGLVGSLGALRYRRDDEAEADRDGMRLLQAAQVDASGMVDFMRTLERNRGAGGRVVSYLSSHPQTAARVAQLELMAREQRYDAKPILDSAAWERVRHMCDSR